MRLHVCCPNCGHPAYGTHTRRLSQLVTEVSYECRNPQCFARFVFQGEVARWLQLPVKLDPTLNVPMSPSIAVPNLQDALSHLRVAELPAAGEMFPPPAGQLDIFSAEGALPHGP